MPGANATLQDFLNYTIMDGLKVTLTELNNIDTNKVPMTFGETSSAYNGGAKTLSESFAAGFLWLDKLGLASLYGFDAVIRQDIWGGSYGLLRANMSTNPDYWLSFVFKKLVGGTVYKVMFEPENPNLRLYGASSKKSKLSSRMAKIYAQPQQMYQVINQTQPWFSANFVCQTFTPNSSILSISNAYENAEISKLLKESTCNQLYIDLYRDDSNNWIWSNNDTNSYRNWKKGYPTEDKTQNCIVFDAMSGTWFNTDCDSSQCYICQKLL